MKNPQNTSIAATTAPAFRQPLIEEDYDFTAVPEVEIVPCLLWEFLRESQTTRQFVRELLDEHIPTCVADAGKNINMQRLAGIRLNINHALDKDTFLSIAACPWFKLPEPLQTPWQKIPADDVLKAGMIRTSANINEPVFVSDNYVDAEQLAKTMREHPGSWDPNCAEPVVGRTVLNSDSWYAGCEAIMVVIDRNRYDNAVAEGRTLEYKQQLPGNGDEDKKEFLADVSSFANAGGGDIIFGVVEKRDGDNKPTSLPEKAEGLAGINAGAEINRLDAIIQSGIEPRIPGCRIRSIDGFASGPVLAIRVPKSWAGPHMVTFKNLSRFFSRTSAGKQQLDVGEIRSAFTASGDLRAKITAFRTERLGKIIANEAPIDLSATPKIVLHLVPLSILNPDSQIGFTLLENDPNLGAPIQNNSYDRRHNLDGYLSFNSNSKAGGTGYCQVFRSGAFEAVDADLLNQSNYSNLIASTHVEQKILQTTARYFKTAKQLGVPLPLIVTLTLTGVKGYAIASGSAYSSFRPTHTIDRDTLLLPDVLLEDYNTLADVAMKPIFDALWQAGGMNGCQHYNEKGRWSALTNY